MPSAWAGELFHRIAVPRLPGTAALGPVEDAIAERLQAIGLEVERAAFQASPRPLMAGSIAGAALGWVALGLAPLLVISVPGWPVAVIGVAALAFVALLAQGVAAGHLSIAGSEVPAVNLVATCGAPALWLLAHSDSKSQRFSLRGRVLATAALGFGTVGLVALLGWRLAGPLPWWAVLPAMLLSIGGGAVLSLGAPRNGSPGGVDNATGVVAALVAAESLAGRTDVGVLVTGAEEFGMAGARAWVEGGAPGGVFVNFDGVDGRGAYRLTAHRARGAPAGSLTDSDVRSALTDAFAAAGAGVAPGNLPIGTFVDGMVLGRAGMPGVTVSRGDWHTLGVVHTARDSADRVDLTAAIEAGEVAAAAVRRLLG